MSTRDSTSAPSDNLNAVLRIINELAIKSDGRNYLYRGERRSYPKVSSSLYRRYEDIEAEEFDIEVLQREILTQAKWYARYTDETDDFEILSQLQHNGGATNLIDFTTDFLIALFFACDGAPKEQGRVILLAENGADYSVEEPNIPVHRVIAQKSVFVRPDKGFVEPDDTVIIANYLKPLVLDYLRNRHGISTETIYNDLHGFIRHQDIHQSAYAELYRGITLAEKGKYEEAIYHYTNAIHIGLNPQIAQTYNLRGIAYDVIGEGQKAIEDYETALDLDPEHAGAYNNLGVAYAGQGNYSRAIEYYSRAIELDADDDTFYNRGEAWLHLGEWENARIDLDIAASLGVDIPASFHTDYQDAADLERRSNMELPEDIAKILDG